MNEKTWFPSPAQIEAAKTKRGGWTAKQLAIWGVPWPPPRGWRAYLRRQWAREVKGQPPLRIPHGYGTPVVVRRLDDA